MSRTREIVAHAHPTSESLKPSEHKLLAEALRRGEVARNEIEDTLVDYGRWILVNVFDDDAAAALAEHSDNPVWKALRDRAGGPTLRLNQRLLYVAVRIAAYDKRINDDVWRGLDAGRKELLLPLHVETSMRAAAKHVASLKLTHRATHAYVSTLLADQGLKRKARVSPRQLVARTKAFRSKLDVEQLRKIVGKLTPEERGAIVKEVEALRDLTAKALKLLR